MERNFEVGEVVFFMGGVSPWFWHKGEVHKVDEVKGVRIGNTWYSVSAVMKDSPEIAPHLLAMNIEKSMMMCKGRVQYEGEKLDSYLTRIRKNESNTGEKE